MKTRFPLFILGLSALIAITFSLAVIAQAEESSTTPFIQLPASSGPPGVMLAKGGGGHHGGGHRGGGAYMHRGGGHHMHHGYHGYRHYRGGFYGYGGWYGGPVYGSTVNCWQWNGYEFVWVCP